MMYDVRLCQAWFHPRPIVVANETPELPRWLQFGPDSCVVVGGTGSVDIILTRRMASFPTPRKWYSPMDAAHLTGDGQASSRFVAGVTS
jgi:hypothetical protein